MYIDMSQLCPANIKQIRGCSEILKMEFLFKPEGSCQKQKLIIKSRCEPSDKCICQHFEALRYVKCLRYDE
ncbi:hypothetical protein BpHYR1_016961 [Brachionus plicatilis]|uniref:Uncharacterized protein n=1 Tax=Brachionus plicatilis TaxID=10195 RepID=A0A3M7SRX9_BRAPC|nr:hypothetical protein BpHYR1_016961 [Brachionus plicatilis]